ILMKQYKEHSVKIQMSEVKAILAKTSPSPQEIFTKELLPLFPSVMHEWFLWSFPCPERWLMSRTAFTRTAAVMSMVGYILGLGDRHCENIMLDERSGDVLHVDFNCLFEKGLLLEKPEKVPFRLTHNMVDAMGVTGYEGTFRKTCEMTLRLLREHRDALMSVLEPFVHDPLVEWSKRLRSSSKASVSAKDPTRPNAQATKSLATINKKLQGALHSQTPLSVEGQVDELIREATDPKRLFQMYIGWAAYM
ncbi:serine/threonine-protein kinase M1, partial [Linderina macrospora]